MWTFDGEARVYTVFPFFHVRHHCIQYCVMAWSLTHDNTARRVPVTYTYVQEPLQLMKQKSIPFMLTVTSANNLYERVASSGATSSYPRRRPSQGRNKPTEAAVNVLASRCN